jgi:hypothetical protein
MSRVLRFVAALALAMGASYLVPHHACRLSSVVLRFGVSVFCLLGLPALACFISRPKVGWGVVLATPFATFAAMLFYLHILHWERFPLWLLNQDNLTTATQCRINLQQLDTATAMWADEFHKSTNDIPTWADLVGTNRFIREQPECSGGGDYRLDHIGEHARCSIPAHNP